MKADNRSDKAKMEHASTLLYSVYQDDYEKRERADKRAQEAKEREKEKAALAAVVADAKSEDAPPSDAPEMRRAPSLRTQKSRDPSGAALRTSPRRAAVRQCCQ